MMNATGPHRWQVSIDIGNGFPVLVIAWADDEPDLCRHQTTMTWLSTEITNYKITISLHDRHVESQTSPLYAQHHHVQANSDENITGLLGDFTVPCGFRLLRASS